MSNRSLLTRIVVTTILAVGVVLVVVYRDRLAADSLSAWVAGFGLLAPLAFTIARVGGALVFVPGSIMGVAAGAAFGFVAGSVYNLVASTIGAIAAFAVARFIAPGWIHARLKHGTMLERLINGVEAEGWRFVAFVRLVPLFPYNVVNYALGLTRISLAQYSVATLICMIPGDLAYVYMGYAAREALAGSEQNWRLGLLALAALATLVFIPRLVQRLRK